MLQGSAFSFSPGVALSDNVNFVAGANMLSPTNMISPLQLYSTTTGNLSWDPDGRGANGAVFLSTLMERPLSQRMIS